MSETKLTVTINNESPIEVTDFTECFESLALQYQQHSYSNYSTNTKLYIKSVRQGSTIIELIQKNAADVLPLFADTNTIIEFTKYLNKGYQYLLGKAQKNNEPKFTISELERLSQILNPPANNTGQTTINFEVKDGGKVVNHFTYKQTSIS